MKFELPADVLNRKKYSQMTKGDIIKETKLSIQKLNRRIARLEKTGFAEYSKSLTRLQDYLKEEYGTKRFSSKHLINASFEERVKFLTQLKHFEGYHLLVSDVKEQIKNEIQTIHDRTEYTLTDKQLLTLNKAMKEYRKAVGSSEISKYLDSDTARKVFTNYIKKFSIFQVFNLYYKKNVFSRYLCYNNIRKNILLRFNMVKLLGKLFIKDYQNYNSPEVRMSYGKLSGIVGIISNLFLRRYNNGSRKITIFCERSVQRFKN